MLSHRRALRGELVPEKGIWAGRGSWDATGKQGHITISQIAPPDRQTTSTSLFTTSTAHDAPANVLTIHPHTASKRLRDTSAIPTHPLSLDLSPHAGSQFRVPKPEPGMRLHILPAL